MVASRAGVALLLVLAAVVLVLAALAAGLRAAQRVGAEALFATRELRIEALRVDAEHLLQRWCAEHGDTLWTPSQQPQQAQLVCDDAWEGADGRARIRLLVWDALAGVPLAVPAARRALRQELPAEWQDLQLDAEAAAPIALLDELSLGAGLRRWPQLPDLPPSRRWSLEAPAGEDPPASGPAAPGPPAPGQEIPTAALLLAPHSDGRLNLRTAAPVLLEAALRGQGRSGILPALLAVRDLGQIPQVPPDLARGQDGLRLVTSTDRWQALLRIEVGGMVRSWWLICAGTDDGVETLQCHAVRD